ncbi:Hapless 2 like protein [Argiope bruennichi]|uniref:Hapless 2 like protein n=1 Tax=Argiope bruennichi TaxID=94029 RepID=A0A8T0FZA8_ARGBR|nr:Hapless 2 like protein [Argiope bruennichi]
MTPEGLEYIYVKEVTESSTGVKVRLLNPIVVRLRQNQIVLAYPFKYLSAVNGKASEIILNHENRKNYTGCDDTSSINPTCGLKFERGRVVPFSEGFCCFCPETPVETKQTRGEQDCSRPAPDLEAQKLKASAHCLHFSDVWYSVSALSDPVIFHDIFLQVYNQRHLINGSAVWVSLTHEEDFELNYKNTSQYDTNKTIVASFFTESPKKGTILISSDENRLLIPQPMPGVELDKLPPAVKEWNYCMNDILDRQFLSPIVALANQVTPKKMY